MYLTRRSRGRTDMSRQLRENAPEKTCRSAVVLGVTADIGRQLTMRLLADNWDVVGLGRSSERLGELANRPAFRFISCDLADHSSIAAALTAYGEIGNVWDLFVSSAGTMEPIGAFFSLDFDQWERSFRVNATAQLRVLHGLWPHRRLDGIVDVMLMAGGGTNGPFTNYSAYCAAKITLIKMCELIDDEEPGVNAFIIGPGFVQTRIHEETLRAGEAAGPGYDKTLRLLETSGTSFDDIYAHLQWCMGAGRGVAGGRNFSTVHDPWRSDDTVFADSLRGNPDANRLRRHEPRHKRAP